MHSNPQMTTQAHEQYLTSRYNEGLSNLKAALNLSHIPVEIPPHVLVAKAVALLKFQFNELQKVESKYVDHSPWEHPKYNQMKNSQSTTTNSHNFKQENNNITKKSSTIYYHDTRHFYKSKAGNMISTSDTSKFCPTIGMQETNDSDLVPPLVFEDDTDCNTMEIDNCLQQQTEQKLGIKCEPSNSSNSSSMDTTNEFSSEWETSAFSMLDDDIEFDIPLDFTSNFM